MPKISYHKLNVILYTILGLFSFVLPISALLYFLEIKLLILPIILVIIGGYFYFRIFKSVIHIIINKPVIESNSERYIDNLNGFSIKWNEVQRISLENRKASFIVFHLKNDSEFYSKLNRFKRAFYKFEAYNTNSVSTNLTFVKGKNEDILTEIQSFYNKVK